VTIAAPALIFFVTSLFCVKSGLIMFARQLTFVFLWSFGFITGSSAAEPATNRVEYAAIEAIFNKHCLDCHAAQEPESGLVMETFETLMKGGESGPVIVPGKSSASLLVQMIEGNVERKGKKSIMPPGKRKKLDTAEITAIRAWIDSGAKAPPDGTTLAKNLIVPKIVPKAPPIMGIKALAYTPSGKLLAIGRYGEVELRSAENRALIRTLAGHRGSVNALVFSPDGRHLFAAAGEAGLLGEVRQWKVSDGQLIRVLEGHRDALYSAAISPDGKILATGSYDQKIKLWKIETGEETKTLSGHNGAIFELAFRPDGKILASASADRTVKLWDVATGERRDTLAQSLKELYTVAFSPDGKRLVAGGVDNRIRVWEISESAAETTNPLLEARFAHEAAILKIAFSTDGKTLASSAEDRTVKIWDAVQVKERLALEAQSDWPSALAFALENKATVVGRLDGTLQFYDTATGKVMVAPKPGLTRAEPRGLQRGITTRIKLTGTNLVGLTEIKLSHPKLTGQLLREGAEMPREAWIAITAAPDLARGTYEVSVLGASGESGRIPLHVDDLPQIYFTKTNAAKYSLISNLPVSIWSVHERPGDQEEFRFDAKSGQTLVFDVAAKSIGSKAETVLTLTDAHGKVLASNSGFDNSSDPLLVHTFTSDGQCVIRVGELLLGGSRDHFYRLSMGEFPYVTGYFPLSIAANTETPVELIGHHLPADRKIKVKAGKTGEMELPLDAERFRSRRISKLLVSDLPEFVESEPNDDPFHANRITAPASVEGRIGAQDRSNDVDLFQFEAKAGRPWIIETAAAQRGSPVDTKIEVLHLDGKPVERVLLQAVRNSAVTFRGIDSNSADCRVENWEEMELNQLLYLQGEVVKLFRAPQGPDSGFVFYMLNGKRRTYFDTTATAHANEEPCYIVEPQAIGTKLARNGLPVFPIYFANDDDGERKLGTDSRLHFSAPADGTYLIRISDARSSGGERWAYHLVVREARPDFTVTLNGANPTVNAGSGQGFSVSVDRMDGFDGEVKVVINNLPPGFTASTPLVIQAGHSEAKGTINAAADARKPDPTNMIGGVITATAMINGQTVTRSVNHFGQIKLGGPARLSVSLEPDSGLAGPAVQPSNGSKPSMAPLAAEAGRILEMTIAPGQTIPAWLKVKRNGFQELVTFTVENLPHGVIVDNIGLNGVLIPKDQNERQIYLMAAKWVPETDRLCYAVENQAGRQTSFPVLLRVRKAGGALSANAR
jgi:mono/diheme cytochrome c family protein